MQNAPTCADALEFLPTIPDKSVDAALIDLPYGTTQCAWDSIIPLEPMWTQLKRVVKHGGAIVLTATQPFSSALVMSNPKMYKYSWIWKKSKATGFLDCKKRPLNNYEEILVFCDQAPPYYPQMTKGKVHKNGGGNPGPGEVYNDFSNRTQTVTDLYYPQRIIEFKTEHGLHPTQKSLALWEYLLLTYTKEGDTVLDCAAGSFTTAIAADNLNRNWICCEKEEKYCTIGRERINSNRTRLNLPPV